MTPATLEAIAARIAIPVDRDGAARAYVEVVDVRPRTTWRVWFGLDGGRVRVPTDVVFDRGRDARALANLLNGDEPAARPAPEPIHAEADESLGDPGARNPERTGRTVPARRSSAAGMPRSCLACGREIPPGSRPQRTTCSGACRVALHDRRRAPAAGRRAAKRRRPETDSGLTVSAALGPSTALEA